MALSPSSHPVEAPRVSFAQLRDFIDCAMQRLGLPAADSATVARLMAQADLQGSDGHGVTHLASYARRILAGGIEVNPEVRVIEERAAMALLDGDNGMGHVVMAQATELAIAKARTCGIAWVGARFSNPAGPASLYARMALEQQMIGLYFAVGNAKHLPPWGGLDLLLSANPIAVAVPALKEAPIVLDMATTAGTEAGHGLSIVTGLLAGTLHGAAVGRAVIDTTHDDTSVTNTGQAIAVIDPAAFGDPTAFRGRVDTLIGELRNSARMPGVDRIWLPGEPCEEKRRRHRLEGIPIGSALVSELDELAKRLDIKPLLDA